MSERDNVVPDDVPWADAAEQARPTADSPEDEQYADEPADLPLEASAADWHEQQQTVVIDDQVEESE